MDSMLNSACFKEELIPTPLNFFQEIEREGTLPNHSMKPVLYSSPNQTSTQQEKGIIGQSL
jgi:hypothetical protein